MAKYDTDDATWLEELADSVMRPGVTYYEWTPMRLRTIAKTLRLVEQEAPSAPADRVAPSGPDSECSVLDAEIAVLHNTCGRYERDIALYKGALSTICALVEQWREIAKPSFTVSPMGAGAVKEVYRRCAGATGSPAPTKWSPK